MSCSLSLSASSLGMSYAFEPRQAVVPQPEPLTDLAKPSPQTLLQVDMRIREVTRDIEQLQDKVHSTAAQALAR
jgi:hypothetical protein